MSQHVGISNYFQTNAMWLFVPTSESPDSMTRANDYLHFWKCPFSSRRLFSEFHPYATDTHHLTSGMPLFPLWHPYESVTGQLWVSYESVTEAAFRDKQNCTKISEGSEEGGKAAKSTGWNLCCPRLEVAAFFWFAAAKLQKKSVTCNKKAELFPERANGAEKSKTDAVWLRPHKGR